VGTDAYFTDELNACRREDNLHPITDIFWGIGATREKVTYHVRKEQSMVYGRKRIATALMMLH